MRGLTATLLETRELAPDVRHFVFRVEGVESFPFVPGQFVSFTAEIGGCPITRAYYPFFDGIATTGRFNPLSWAKSVAEVVKHWSLGGYHLAVPPVAPLPEGLAWRASPKPRKGENGNPPWHLAPITASDTWPSCLLGNLYFTAPW